MKRNSSMVKRGTAVLLTAACLSGCAGPSTKVLPQRQGGTIQEVPEEIPVVEEVNSFYLQESLEMLSINPRPAGSRGEDGAARYIQNLLKDYGYTVNRQRFREKTEHAEVLGTNVTAVRTAEDPDADILLIGTWHDSAPESPGAGNNASGVSVFLETARILSGLPTDTEVRFVSLSAHENDALGARIYTQSLSKRERERLIGVIMIGPCGAVDTEETVLATQDGSKTMLGDLLQESADSITGNRWRYVQKAGLENGIFASCAVPSVQIGQQYDSFDFGTPLDTVDTVDAECLSGIVDTLCQTVSKVMSLETPSMRARAHFENNWNEFIYTAENGSRIPFGISPGLLQARLGIPGKLAVVNRDSQNRPIEKYLFHMRWFGLDKLFTTSYYFTDEQLDLVSLTPEDTGLTPEAMQEQITAACGEPVKTNSGPYGKDCVWQNPETGEQVELIPGRESFEVEIRSYTPAPALLARCSLDGTLQEGEAQNRENLEPLISLCRVLFAPLGPDEAPVNLVFETDGAGGQVISLKQEASDGQAAKTADDSGREQGAEMAAPFAFHIDPADFPFTNGILEERTEALKTLVRAYGQLLKENGPAVYVDGYTELLQSIRGEAVESPDTAPGETPKLSVSLPEFEDAFALYVLAEKPFDNPGAYQECVRYFYQFEELNTYRSAVRTYLGLQTEE